MALVLHLFDRRRNVAIDWERVQLQEASTRRTRSRRLQHWLLLALRVLAVAALVLGFARPLVRGQWLASHDRREVVLVIDNSLSTASAASPLQDLNQKSFSTSCCSRQTKS